MEGLAITTSLILIMRVLLERISSSLRGQKNVIHQPRSVRIGKKLYPVISTLFPKTDISAGE